MRNVIAHVRYQEEMKGAEGQGSRGLLRRWVEDEVGFTEQDEERREGQEAGVDSSQVQLLMSANHSEWQRKPSSSLPSRKGVQLQNFVTFFSFSVQNLHHLDLLLIG